MRKYHKSPISSHHSWLRSIVLLCVMIISASLASTASAQTAGGAEAFYIYQNDGHFDGFFYDEVKQINYSRTDTLGVEHDHYVSQEIVTNDSTYRIMLTAIDSVSFVQPEIKFAKSVRFMQEEGMMDYFLLYLNDDEMGKLLGFSITMPEALRPKVGDVLTCRNMEGHDGMFVAKVTKVAYTDEVIAVQTEYVEDISDVFEQFITVEEVRKANSPAGARSITRTAGMSKGTQAWEGNIDDITLFNATAAIEGKVSYGDFSLGLQASVGFGMTFKATYNIGLSKFYIKTEMKEQIAAGFNASLDGQLNDTFTPTNLPGVGALIARFSKVPFPASFPLLYVDGTPKPFTRAEAHLNLNLSTGVTVKSLVQSMEITDKFPFISIKMGFLPVPFLPLTFEPSANWSISAQLNGMVQTGIMFPIEVGSEDWMKKILKVKADATLYAGPKISGALNLDLINAITGKGMYESMKDSKVDLTLMSLDEEFEAEATVGNVGAGVKKVVSGGFGTYPLQLFANISDVNFEITGEKMNTVTATFNTSADVFLPQKLGFALYQKEDKDDENFSKLYRYVTRPEVYFLNTFNSVELQMDDVAPGEYMVRPIVNTIALGNIPVYSEEQKITIVSQDLELKPGELTAEEDGGEFSIKILNSLANGDYEAVTYEDWVEAKVVKDNTSLDLDSKVLQLTVKPNETEKYRTTTVAVRQTIDGKFVEKTLTVHQYGGLELSPSSLNVQKEGGESTIQILTSRSPITIDLNGNDDWIEDILDGRTLTLRIKKNAGANRTADITIAAWNEKAQGISTVTLTVRQEGAVNASLQPSALEFQADGGTKQVAVTVGEGFTFTGVRVADADAEWLIIEKGKDYCNVTALPNVTTQQRVGKAYCEVTKSATGEKAELPITVTQEFGEASVTPKAMLFGESGGTQQAQINFGNYTYCGAYVSDDATGWIKATPESDGSVKVIVSANPSPLQREGTVYCWVSSVKNPGDEQMMLLPLTVTQEPSTALQPVTPDGDKSPFKYITFWATRKVLASTNSSGSSSSEEEPMDLNQAFTFTPDNSQFKVTYGKELNHYECKGYSETGGSQPSKAAATLTFDIEKATKKVKNLRYTANSEVLMDFSMWGATAHSTTNLAATVLLSDFPLQTNNSSYKEGKWSVSDGLAFTTFSIEQNSRAYYTIDTDLGRELYPDGIDPVSTQQTFVPLGYGSDYVQIMVSYKDGQGEPVELEWPSDEVLQSLRTAGMDIYEGANPPTINGTYHVSPLAIVSDPTGEASAELSGDVTMGVVLKFSAQANGQLTMQLYPTINGKADEAVEPQPGLVMGSGNKFSACIPDKFGGAQVFSGELVDGVIYNLKYAGCNMKTAGEHVILKDSDGSSSQTSWSPGSGLDW